jgi:hypothetical protein
MNPNHHPEGANEMRTQCLEQRFRSGSKNGRTKAKDKMSIFELKLFND